VRSVSRNQYLCKCNITMRMQTHMCTICLSNTSIQTMNVNKSCVGTSGFAMIDARKSEGVTVPAFLRSQYTRLSSEDLDHSAVFR